ncbi:unnamed protein product [Mycena citricolor]|uniref:HTH CENPB-type domain-containing protein n=1 Tax=Mycena citricolor TaxID=2018698 RepID=A0AAD2JZB7_9AGAR|nr:unnamed protein product [Mycena citricolor]
MQAQPNAAVFCDFSAQSWQTMYNGQGPYATDGTFQTVDSSAGPSRVLTRRQRALAHEHRPYDIQARLQSFLLSYAVLILLQALRPIRAWRRVSLITTSIKPDKTRVHPFWAFSSQHAAGNAIALQQSTHALYDFFTLHYLQFLWTFSCQLPFRSDKSRSISGAQYCLRADVVSSASLRPERPIARAPPPPSVSLPLLALRSLDPRAPARRPVRNSQDPEEQDKMVNVPVDEELKIAKHRPSKFPEIETDMMDVLLAARDNNAPLTDAFIRIKAREVALKLGIGEDRFKASAGWVENFKHRHGIKGGIWSGHGRNVRAAASRGAGLDPICWEIPATGPSWLMAPVEPPPGVHPSSAPVSQSPNTPDEIAPVVDAASWMMSNAPPPPSHDDPGNLSGWLTQSESAQSSVDEAAWISPNHNGEMAADQLSSNQHSANAPWAMQQTTNDDEQPPSKAHANLAFNFVTDYLRQCGQELDPQLAAAVCYSHLPRGELTCD